MGRTLVVASNNKKKLTELTQIVSRLAPSVRLVSAREAGVPEPEETGATFRDNALIKAMAAYQLTGETCLADDSGLEVDFLEGRPGVHSARFAGPQANDEDNNRKLLELLAGVPAPLRTARYRCVIAVILPPPLAAGLRSATAGLECVELPDGALAVFADGAADGVVLTERRGEGGFGYDPWMLHEATGQTFAELPAEVKNTISHRGQALAKLEGLIAGLG